MIAAVLISRPSVLIKVGRVLAAPVRNYNMGDIHLPISETKHLAAGSECPPSKPGVVRLYSMKFCPYAQRARLVLASKNVPNEVVNINLQSKPEWYFALNPLGKVPCIEVEGQLIFESLIIADYLDEVYPEPYLLNNIDPMQKAKDRIMVELFNKVLSSMYKMYHAGNDLDALKQHSLSMEEGLKLFEDELTKRGSKFYSGDEPGMLDYMIWPWMERMPALPILSDDVLEIPKDQYPNLIKWFSSMKEDRAVRESIISGEDHAKFIRSHLAGRADYDMDLSKP